jgi:hypothetical protein
MTPGSVINREYKGLNVPHPVLRCTLRIIAYTIFARGETVARANEVDLQLLDHMLRPDDELERPDLMLIMVQHWLGQQRSRRRGGVVSICAYVTFIAEKLGVPIPTTGADRDIRCRGPRLLDVDHLRSYKFIRIEQGPTGRIFFWLMPDERTMYRLPFPVPLSFTDRSTWLFSRSPRTTHTPPRATRTPPPPPPPLIPSHPPSPQDVEMADAPPSPPQR